jgi:hypothetical protein
VRVILPYTKLRKPVIRALDATGYEYERHDVSGSDRDYFDLLVRLWDQGETFCIVEHDIVIHPTALSELHVCSGDWCGFPHTYAGQTGYWLGCVKFTDRLIQRHRDLIARLGVIHGMNYPRRHWYRLDPFLQQVLLPNDGEQKCEHPTVVRHLGDCVAP